MSKYNKIGYGLKHLKKNVEERNKKKFYNKNGDLNLYSFSCGYIQIAESLDENVRVRMFLDNGHFHIRVYSFNEKDAYTSLPWLVIGKEDGGLTEARKEFKRLVREYLLT